jgi:hypothetical protein
MLALHEKEKELLKQLGVSEVISSRYTYDLVREYSSFYQTVPILLRSETDKVFDSIVK